MRAAVECPPATAGVTAPKRLTNRSSTHTATAAATPLPTRNTTTSVPVVPPEPQQPPVGRAPEGGLQQHEHRKPRPDPNHGPADPCRRTAARRGAPSPRSRTSPASPVPPRARTVARDTRIPTRGGPAPLRSEADALQTASRLVLHLAEPARRHNPWRSPPPCGRSSSTIDQHDKEEEEGRRDRRAPEQAGPACQRRRAQPAGAQVPRRNHAPSAACRRTRRIAIAGERHAHRGMPGREEHRPGARSYSLEGPGPAELPLERDPAEPR